MIRIRGGYRRISIPSATGASDWYEVPYLPSARVISYLCHGNGTAHVSYSFCLDSSVTVSLTGRPRGSCIKSDVAPRSWWWLEYLWWMTVARGTDNLKTVFTPGFPSMHLLVTGLTLWCFIDSSGRFEVRYALAFHAEMLWLLTSTLLLTASIKSYMSHCIVRRELIPWLSTSDRVKIQDQQPEASVRYLNHKLDQLCIFCLCRCRSFLFWRLHVCAILFNSVIVWPMSATFLAVLFCMGSYRVGPFLISNSQPRSLPAISMHSLHHYFYSLSAHPQSANCADNTPEQQTFWWVSCGATCILYRHERQVH